MIWNPFQVMLWGMTIIILFVCVFQWLNNGLKREKITEKLILFGFAAFLLCFNLMILFYIVGNFYIPGMYIDGNFWGDFNLAAENFFIFNRLGNVTASIGISLWFLTFERIYKRTKYVLTVTNTILVFIMIISPFEIYSFIQTYIIRTFSIIGAMFIFLLYTRWTRYELKAISSLILFGLLNIMIGLTIYNPSLRATNVIPLIFAPLIVIIGSLIILSPSYINPTHFNRARIYWFCTCIISSIINWLLFIFMILHGIILNLIITLLIFIIAGTIMLFYTMIMLKPQSADITSEKLPDVLTIFARPQRLTEEEITISIEKKICLVCKGKVQKFNSFICECNILYCEKCARKLSDMENMCWVCESPIDESKPVRPYKEEVAIKTEEKIQKNSKSDKLELK